MRKVLVNINTVEEVSEFVKEVSKFPGEVHITLVSGRYVVDAKSLLGVFSLDLSKPVEVKVENEHPYAYITDEVYKVLAKFEA